MSLSQSLLAIFFDEKLGISVRNFDGNALEETVSEREQVILLKK